MPRTLGYIFADNIKPMLDLVIPGEMAGFSIFLDGFTEYENEMRLFTQTWKKALTDFSTASTAITGNIPFESWLPSAANADLEKWRELANTRGFMLDAKTLSEMQLQISNLKLKQQVIKELSDPAMRLKWREKFQVSQKISVDEMLLMVGNTKYGSIFAGKYTPEQLKTVSDGETNEARISRTEKRLSGKVGNEYGKQGLSGRQFFLLLISFVVCMVGIANAMLMSITERFREIATMKCLGATDQYILIQFMMEAGLQGIAGGFVGMIIGFMIATFKNGIIFGSYVFTYWPGLGLLVSGIISIAVGVLLAVMASIYPSWAASRMAPMDAMRIE